MTRRTDRICQTIPLNQADRVSAFIKIQPYSNFHGEGLLTGKSGMLGAEDCGKFIVPTKVCDNKL